MSFTFLCSIQAALASQRFLNAPEVTKTNRHGLVRCSVPTGIECIATKWNDQYWIVFKENLGKIFYSICTKVGPKPRHWDRVLSLSRCNSALLILYSHSSVAHEHASFHLFILPPICSHPRPSLSPTSLYNFLPFLPAAICLSAALLSWQYLCLLSWLYNTSLSSMEVSGAQEREAGAGSWTLDYLCNFRRESSW